MNLLEKYSNLIEILKNNPNVENIILFGSYAKNKVTPKSDLDLAITFKINTKEEIKNDILSNSSEELDLKDFFTLPPAVKINIINEGKIIKKGENFQSIKMQTRNEWIDFKPRLNRMYKSRGYPQIS